MTNKDIGDMSLEELRDYIRNSPFLRSNKWGEILADRSAGIEKRVSEIEGKQKETKLILGDEEIKKIVGERYKELIDQELAEAIKGKGGVMHSLRKYLGLTTAGLFVVLALAGGVSLIYLKNKTTTGNILNIESSVKKTKAENEKVSSDFKKYVEDNNGKIKNLEDQTNSRMQDYEKAVSTLKTSNEEYKKEMDELKKQKQDYDKKFDELENKVSGTEGRLNSLLKYEKRQKK